MYANEKPIDLRHMAANAKQLDLWRKFIVEREAVRLKKEAAAPMPWTKDPIIRDFHFCNVCRADDRVTKWIGEWAGHWKKSERWFAYVVARWFNEPKTLIELKYSFDPHRYKSTLLRMIKNQQKVFRASYIINGFTGMPKYVSVVDKVLLPLWEASELGSFTIYPKDMERCHTELMQYPGMGSFMAGQIVMDWQTFGIIHGTDRYAWAPIGPGSARGLQHVFQLPKLPKQAQAVELMVAAFAYLRKHEPAIASRLILHDVQNCFCEYSKYCRGWSKTKYKPFDTKQSELF